MTTTVAATDCRLSLCLFKILSDRYVEIDYLIRSECIFSTCYKVFAVYKYGVPDYQPMSSEPRIHYSLMFSQLMSLTISLKKRSPFIF